MDRPVLFVCSDPGGMHAIVPVYDAWVRGGASGILIASGKAVELLQRGPRPRPFRWYPSAHAALMEIHEPEALVLSFCEGRRFGLELIPLLRGRCPTIGHLDFWSAPFRLGGLFAAKEHHPDYVAVSDRFGTACARVGWDGPVDHIVELGFPALDECAAMDRAAVALEIRRNLSITGDAFVVLVAGQDTGSAAMLRVVARAIGEVRAARPDRPIVLVPREHPRMRVDWGEEAIDWDAALRALPEDVRVVNGSAYDDAVRLIAASDTVVSWCSTMLITAAALRCHPIAWQPPVELARYRAVTGGALDEFPIVAMGCGWKATTEPELVSALTRAFDGDAVLLAAQERELQLDGKNAERVVTFVRSLVSR